MVDGALLWIDARLKKTTESLQLQFPFSGRVHFSENTAQAMSAVQSCNPDVIVFDYDYADITGLRALQSIRQAYANIPVLMLAEQHYESLSIWALRCRVWDYLVKPVDSDVLARSIDRLLQAKQHTSMSADWGWQTLMPSNRIPLEACILGSTKNMSATSSAIQYMKAHLHEKITAQDVSSHCGLTRYDLSRVFKAEHNKTFQDYLLGLRMSRAAKMLQCTQASITEIALSVGFNDLSYFTRKFHALYGCAPGVYRKEKFQAGCRDNSHFKSSKK